MTARRVCSHSDRRSLGRRTVGPEPVTTLVPAVVSAVVACALVLAGCSTDGQGVAEPADEPVAGRGREAPAGPNLDDPTSPVPARTGSTPPQPEPETVPELVDGTLAVPETLFPEPVVPLGVEPALAVLVDGTIYDLAGDPGGDLTGGSAGNGNGDPAEGTAGDPDPVDTVWSHSGTLLAAAGVPTIVDEGVLALIEEPGSGAVTSGAVDSRTDISAPVTGTLVLQPGDGGRPIDLAREVSSFVVGPAGRTFAWTEPVGVEPSAATRVVMAALPFGRITSSLVFEGVDAGPNRVSGRAVVVAIVGDNVVVRAGDPGGDVALVSWATGSDTTYRLMNYDPWVVGPSWANRLILLQADAGCGVVVEVTGEGPAQPADGAEVPPDLPCTISRAATISHEGTAVASAGTTGATAIDGDPVVLVTPIGGDTVDDAAAGGRRLRVEGVPGAYWQPRETRWLDDRRFVVLASSHNGEPLQAADFVADPDAITDPRTVERWRSHWGLYLCELDAGACRLAREIGFQPTTGAQIALVPIRFRPPS